MFEPIPESFPAFTLKIQAVYDYVKSRKPEKISRRDVADALGISYYAAKYRLDKLVDLGRLDFEKRYTRIGTVYRVWFLAIIVFIHYTVVGTMITRDTNTVLRAACTLDYDVDVDEEVDYYKKAVRKIDLWFTEMFQEREIKFSSETSRTLESVRDALREEEEEVTDIIYDWWWARSGTTSNEETDEGLITWEEDIPLGASGGWFTPGAPRR